MSKVTVVIPSLPQADRQYLKVCVESLRESGFDGDIIVVMNGTRDMDPLYDTPIQGITKKIVTKQQGQCNAVNAGAQLAEGDCKWLLVSNADMYYVKDWDNGLLQACNRPDSDMPLCWSPNLVEPTNNAGSAKPFLKLDAGFTLDEFKPEVVADFVEHYEYTHEVEDGFNLPFVISRELWNTIGGYDTKYDPWGSNSDTDLQTLIEIAGVKPKRYRDALVYHFSNKSGTFDGTHQEEWQRNFDYYRTKFGYTRDDEPKADTWYCKNMVLQDKLIFHPEWEGKYANDTDR